MDQIKLFQDKIHTESWWFGQKFGFLVIQGKNFQFIGEKMIEIYHNFGLKLEISENFDFLNKLVKIFQLVGKKWSKFIIILVSRSKLVNIWIFWTNWWNFSVYRSKLDKIYHYFGFMVKSLVKIGFSGQKFSVYG